MKRLAYGLLCGVLLAFSLVRPALANEPITIENPQLHSVHEYGSMQALIDQSADFSALVLYPKIGIEAVDKAIADWAAATYQTAKEAIGNLQASNAAARAELNVQYDSHWVDKNYVGVAEYGFSTGSHLAHPIEFNQTYNIDLVQQRLLTNEQILDPQQNTAILALLKSKILAQYPEAGSGFPAMDAGWLKQLVLTPGGVDVILNRGDYLPASYGTVTIHLAKAELGQAYILQPQATADAVTTGGAGQAAAATTAPAAEAAPSTAAPAEAATYTVDPSKPMIALTFDDGPSAHTARILELLEQYNGRATFCMVGNRVRTYADTVKQVAAQGSEIIGHSWDHKDLTKLSAEAIKRQLTNTNQVLNDVAGVTPKLFRPPYGAVNSTLKSVAKDQGMAMLYWSVDPEDWRTRDADTTYERIMSHAQNGSIILCHDLYKATADAMERVIPALVEKGYQLVTVSDLLNAAGGMEAGQVYYHGTYDK